MYVFKLYRGIINNNQLQKHKYLNYKKYKYFNHVKKNIIKMRNLGTTYLICTF